MSIKNKILVMKYKPNQARREHFRVYIVLSLPTYIAISLTNVCIRRMLNLKTDFININ